MKILAIDDNKDNLTTLKAIVQDVLPACTLLTALNGPRGIELALAEDPDVILLDIVMPDMDGHEVCRRLKADERSRPIPVVFLTALRTDRESRIQALDCGADGFLAKPVDEQELIAEVRAMAKVKAASLMLRDETTRLAGLVAERTQSLQQSQRSLLNTLEDMRAENEARKQAEAKAKREQLLSNTIIDSIPGTFYLLDENGCYVRWNTYQRDVILGKLEDQIAGLNALDTIHPEDRDLVQARIANVLRDGKDEMVEGRVLLNGGPAFIWMLMTGRRMMIAGRPCLVGSGVDITAHKQAEAALRMSEERHRTILQTAMDGVWLADMQGRLLEVNDAYCRMSGYNAQELLAMRISDLEANQTAEEVASNIQKVKAAGEVRFETRHRRKDGSLVDVAIGIQYRPADGGQFVVFLHDITERKRAESELLASKALTDAVVEHVPLMIFLKEATDLRFVIFNRAGEELMGYDRKALLGKNNLDLFPPEQAANFMAKDREALKGQGEVDIPEESILTAKKGERLLHTRKVCIRGSDGETRFLLGISEDITDHKRAAAEHEKLQAQFAQAQKMESVGRLAGGVAHDFNNLLMGIMNYTQLCRDKIAPDHPIQEYLAEIRHDAERSAEITRQLLAFARKQTIAPRVLDLNGAVAGMLKLLQRLIGEDIKLAWRPGVDLRPVKLDPSQVDQILANLCVNSRDAIEGVGEITLETGSTVVDAEYCARHPEAIPGAYVFLAVSDDGCGMDKETLAQVFEPFFTTKGLGKGTGLGLATVYGIVKQNNGFIYAYSEPGKGTTFKIYLPEIAAETVATTVTGKAEAPRGRGETILLAEDEKSLRVTCGLFLEALGYKVLTAETPGEALKMVAGHPGDIHVLLTDVVMPGMDGRQLAKRISEVKPSVKVLFMSGYTVDVIAQRGVLDEGVQFLSKPFTRDDLARKVREMLDSPRPG